MDDKYEKAIADINSDRRTNSFSNNNLTNNHTVSGQQQLQNLGKFLNAWIIATTGTGGPLLRGGHHGTPRSEQSLMAVSQVERFNSSRHPGGVIHQKVWEA